MAGIEDSETKDTLVVIHVAPLKPLLGLREVI